MDEKAIDSVARLLLEQAAFANAHAAESARLSKDPGLARMTDQEALGSPAVSEGMKRDMRSLMETTAAGGSNLERVMRMAPDEQAEATVRVGAAMRRIASEDAGMRRKIEGAAKAASPSSTGDAEGLGHAVGAIVESAATAIEMTSAVNRAMAQRDLDAAAGKPAWPPQRVDLGSWRKEREKAAGSSQKGSVSTSDKMAP